MDSKLKAILRETEARIRQIHDGKGALGPPPSKVLEPLPSRHPNVIAAAARAIPKK